MYKFTYCDDIMHTMGIYTYICAYLILTHKNNELQWDFGMRYSMLVL